MFGEPPLPVVVNSRVTEVCRYGKTSVCAGGGGYTCVCGAPSFCGCMIRVGVDMEKRSWLPPGEEGPHVCVERLPPVATRQGVSVSGCANAFVVTPGGGERTHVCLETSSPGCEHRSDGGV